jgi:hypothetical protein
MTSFRTEDVPAVLRFAQHQAERMRRTHRRLWRLFWRRGASRELRRLERAIAFYDRAVLTADQFPDSDARATMVSAVWFGRWD